MSRILASLATVPHFSSHPAIRFWHWWPNLMCYGHAQGDGERITRHMLVASSFCSVSRPWPDVTHISVLLEVSNLLSVCLHPTKTRWTHHNVVNIYLKVSYCSFVPRTDGSKSTDIPGGTTIINCYKYFTASTSTWAVTMSLEWK